MSRSDGKAAAKSRGRRRRSDVTALSRLPVDDWIGLEADSHWASDGIAVGAATLFDRDGAFGTGLVTAVSNPAAQIDFGNDPFPSRTR